MKNQKPFECCKTELNPAQQHDIHGGVKTGGCVGPSKPFEEFPFIPFGPPCYPPVIRN
ncbi:hypothetical protein [Dyadobacter flavalbus]|uniref:hypothetical protein n=1 Tax=Dyadobacter flavalbus TaxID=2579942 RepID=UPI001375665B|nr:hypothetical protein [Dyadobacter flavalbus]